MPRHGSPAPGGIGRGPGEAFWPDPQPGVDGRSVGLNLAESSFPPREDDLYLRPLGPPEGAAPAGHRPSAGDPSTAGEGGQARDMAGDHGPGRSPSARDGESGSATTATAPASRDGGGDEYLAPDESPARHRREGQIWRLTPLQVFSGLVAGVVLLVGIVVVTDRVTRSRTTQRPPSATGRVRPPATQVGSRPGGTGGPAEPSTSAVATSTSLPAVSSTGTQTSTTPSTTTPTSTTATSAGNGPTTGVPPLPWRLETEPDGSSRLVVGDVSLIPTLAGSRVQASTDDIPKVSGWYCVTEAGPLRRRGATLVAGPSSTECHNRPGKVRQTSWVMRRVGTGAPTRVGDIQMGEWSSSGSAYAAGFTIPCTGNGAQSAYSVAVAPQFEGGQDLPVAVEGTRLQAACNAGS